MGEAGAEGLLTEGDGLLVSHGSANGDEVGGFSGGGEDFRLEETVLATDGGGFLPGLVFVVVGEGDDAPLETAVGSGEGLVCGLAGCVAGRLVGGG